MNLFVLWRVLSASFIGASYSETPSVYEQGLLDKIQSLLKRRQFPVSVTQITNDPDPVAIMVNWCLGFGDRWSLFDSYETFIRYCESHHYDCVLQQDNYRSFFQVPFEYVYKAVQAFNHGDVPKVDPSNSYVCKWLVGNQERCKATPYILFNQTHGYAQDSRGRDSYFERIVTSIVNNKLRMTVDRLTSVHGQMATGS